MMSSMASSLSSLKGKARCPDSRFMTGTYIPLVQVRVHHVCWKFDNGTLSFLVSYIDNAELMLTTQFCFQCSP